MKTQILFPVIFARNVIENYPIRIRARVRGDGLVSSSCGGGDSGVEEDKESEGLLGWCLFLLAFFSLLCNGNLLVSWRDGLLLLLLVLVVVVVSFSVYSSSIHKKN